jgi:uncharacterized protein YegJ (DUF2314 family)
MGRAPWLGLALILLICMSCGGLFLWFLIAAKNQLRSVVRVNYKDARLQEAAKVAKATLPDFRGRLAHPQKGDKFAIEGKFPTEVGAEYLWLRTPKIIPGGYRGILDQTPLALHAHRGQELNVKTENVYDWMIERADGSKAGGFTQIALGAKG